MGVVLIGGINNAEEAAGGFELDDLKRDEFRLFAGHGYAVQKELRIR